MFKTDFKKEKFSLIVFLLVLFFLFYQLMRPFVMSLILSGIFVVLFYPGFQKLKDKTRKPRLSAFLVTLGIFFMILLPATLTIMMVVDQAFSILHGLDLRQLYKGFFVTSFYQDTITPLFEHLKTRIPIEIDFFAMLTEVGQQLASGISRFSPRVFFSTAGFFFDFFIMMVSIYFLFLEGPILLRIFYVLSPMRDAHEKRLLREVKNTIDASVYGYLLTALVQAFLATFAFWISGIPGFVVLGTMTFFMSMVPIIGAAGIWLPVCLALFLNGQVGWGVFNAVWGALLISGIDNILKPLIIQGKTRIHPLLVFFSLFGGIAWFGPFGILFGPVITAVLIATIRIYRDELIGNS